MMKPKRQETTIEFVYSALSFREKVAYNLKHFASNWTVDFKSIGRKLLVLLVIALMGLGLFLVVKANQISFPVRSEYDKTGFISASDYVTQFGSTTTIENDGFVFAFDNNKTTFSLEDKHTNETWLSNPSTTSSRFLSPIKLYYEGSLGKVISIGVKEEAVDWDDYLIKVEGNTLFVLYLVGGKKDIDATDFPRIISAARMEELILSKLDSGSTDYRRITEQAYVFGNVSGVDVWKLKDGIQTSILKNLYRIMYDDCGYTTDELAIDNAENGIVNEDVYPYFEIAISYELTDSGISVRVINDSIVEKEKYPLVYVDVLPYFGAGLTTDEGYLFVPDGSGGLIDFNNNRSFALPYNQRIYGNDLAQMAQSQPTNNPTIHLPVVGMVKNGHSFISIAEEGDAMTNVLANISTQDNPYNQVYYRYNFREYEVYEFSSINSSVSINQWTIWYNSNDFVADYRFIQKDDATYSDMAKEYQSYLIEKGILSNLDTTTVPVVDLTLLGGYVIDENFLGIPYKTVKALTNTSQAIDIVSSLVSDGISDLNVFYNGFSNDGLKPYSMENISYNANIGSKKDFTELVSTLNTLGINFYPEALVSTAYTDKGINVKNSAIRNVFGKVVSNYGYNPASLYQDPSTRKWYPLKPETFQDTIDGLSHDLEKIGASNLMITDLADRIYGSYRKKDTTFRTDYLRMFTEVMNASSFENIAFRNPNLYAIPYVSLITDTDLSCSDYQIITDSVPFLQLVFSGYLDYSGKSMNIDDEHSYRYHVMKTIETLSNLSMTWSAVSTIDLVDTEYSNYYSTFYENWYDTLLSTYEEIDDLGIYGLSLSAHTILDAEGLITQSNYSDGTIIIFNYSSTDFNYQSTMIPSMDYLVLRTGA